jgi:hypothetical protein
MRLATIALACATHWPAPSQLHKEQVEGKGALAELQPVQALERAAPLVPPELA